MEKPIINYETLIRITKAISMIRDPDEIVLVTVEGVTSTLYLGLVALGHLLGFGDDLSTVLHQGALPVDDAVDVGRFAHGQPANRLDVDVVQRRQRGGDRLDLLAVQLQQQCTEIICYQVDNIFFERLLRSQAGCISHG